MVDSTVLGFGPRGRLAEVINGPRLAESRHIRPNWAGCLSPQATPSISRLPFNCHRHQRRWRWKRIMATVTTMPDLTPLWSHQPSVSCEHTIRPSPKADIVNMSLWTWIAAEGPTQVSARLLLSSSPFSSFFVSLFSFRSRLFERDFRLDGFV